jgi:two-component system phosphate regulon sensor histidine kinase PhoR
LLLLALPLAVAVWAFGAVAARRERSNADSRLVHVINVAAGKYELGRKQARIEARSIAGEKPVQRAFIHHNRSALRRLERAHAAHAVLLLLPNEAGRVSPLGIAGVTVPGGKMVGRVQVGGPTEKSARRFADEAHQPPGGVGFLLKRSLVTGAGTTAIPGWPELRKPRDLSNDRVVAVPLGGRVALVAVKPRSEISAAANSIRWRVIAVGLGVVAALLVLVYAVAPAIARSRLSRQERDQAERVLAHLGDGVLVVDREGVVRLWNRAAEAITGLRAENVRNRRADEAIPGWATIAAFVPIANRPGDSYGVSTEETVPVDIDGNELWLSVVAVALDEDTVYAFRDATHERRLENLRSQFVATISHEIRTPLASLHGAALTLREHDLPAQTQDDLLVMIAEQSNRLARLVEEILVAGQLESGSLSVVSDAFDPEKLVRDVVGAARARVGEETTIEIEMPPVLPKVHGDEERTRQVLLNLVDNAIKYSPSGGRIEVSLSAVGEWLRFSVQDEGLGIPVGEQERIFEKFYRLDPDQRRGIGGTGLGLYICRELIRSMGGRIWVESEPGHGTTASFELPAEPVTVAAKAS